MKKETAQHEEHYYQIKFKNAQYGWFMDPKHYKSRPKAVETAKEIVSQSRASVEGTRNRDFICDFKIVNNTIFS